MPLPEPLLPPLILMKLPSLMARPGTIGPIGGNDNVAGTARRTEAGGGCSGRDAASNPGPR